MGGVLIITRWTDDDEGRCGLFVHIFPPYLSPFTPSPLSKKEGGKGRRVKGKGGVCEQRSAEGLALSIRTAKTWIRMIPYALDILPHTTSIARPIALVYPIPSSKETDNLLCRENIRYFAYLVFGTVWIG